MEFGLVPKFVDLHVVVRTFRACKLWEWSIGETQLRERTSAASAHRTGTEPTSNGLVPCTPRWECDCVTRCA